MQLARHKQSSDPSIAAAAAYNGSMPRIPTITIIGAGPRGTSLIERIGAHLSGESSRGRPPGIALHVIDDAPLGAGRIWRTDQTRELCMNTLADAVTLFTEPGSTVSGCVRPGPTLYEWALLALQQQEPGALPPELSDVIAAIPASRAREVDAHPIRAGFADDSRDELLALRPESHPSRALYGEYLAWCFTRALAELPADVRVVRHASRAVSLTRLLSGGDRVELANGSSVDADAVVLATGWMPRSESRAERALAETLLHRPQLTWVRPGSPVEQDLSDVRPGDDAIVRGVGMGFFDTMALVTLGRGGRFVPDTAARGGLRYVPSGHEPILHVTSGRGVPFRAKTLYGSLPPRAEQRFLLGVDWAAIPRPIDFDRELWPRIVADAHFDHFRTLSRVHPGAVAGSADDAERAIADAILPLVHRAGAAALTAAAQLEASAEAVARAVAPLIPDPADRLDLLGEMRPVRRDFDSVDAYGDWVQERVARDLAEAELGRDSALKAGLWSVSSARGVANRLGSVGGFDAESRESGFAMLQAVGGMAGSGPPAFRNRQLLALAEAGLVRFIGPGARIAVTERGFTAASPRVAGPGTTAPALIDAWMHVHDIAETADPLARSLISAGRAQAFHVRERDGGLRATGAFDTDPASGRIIATDGSRDASVHVAGIPVDAQLHDTIISPMPGTDPPMLRETDRVARSLVEIALRRAATAPEPRTLEGAHHA